MAFSQDKLLLVTLMLGRRSNHSYFLWMWMRLRIPQGEKRETPHKMHAKLYNWIQYKQPGCVWYGLCRYGSQGLAVHLLKWLCGVVGWSVRFCSNIACLLMPMPNNSTVHIKLIIFKSRAIQKQRLGARWKDITHFLIEFGYRVRFLLLIVDWNVSEINILFI